MLKLDDDVGERRSVKLFHQINTSSSAYFGATACRHHETLYKKVSIFFEQHKTNENNEMNNLKIML